MRHARTRLRDGRRTFAALLLGGFCSCGWGCHQHHYYYYGASGAGACPPGASAVLPSAVTTGPVCEVPSEVDGGTVVSRSTVVDDGGGKPRVVVSRPEGRSSRFGWRSTNPEDVPAFTQIEGAAKSTVK